MNIKLILAAEEDDHVKGRRLFMPLSLSTLVSAAPEHNYTLIDLLNSKRDKINYNDKTDLVGISVKMSSEKSAFEIADKFRKNYIPVILGGPQASANPYVSKQHADAVVIGEGELLWPRLLCDFENNKLKDFYVCSPNEFNAGNYTVHFLDNLPDLKSIKRPAHNAFKNKYKFDTVYASRGCPIDCDFCLVSKVFGKNTRTRPINDVVNEIKKFKGYYYLIDDNVFGRKGSYDYYYELYDRISKLPGKKYWMGQANLKAVASNEGRKVIKKAVESGLIYAAVGLESINPDTLKTSGSIKKMGIQKDNDVVSDMKDKIEFLQDSGIILSGWFTIGYENDTVKSYYETLEFCRETNIFPVINPVYALHGSRLFERLEKEGKLLNINTNATNVPNKNISNNELIKALLNIENKGYSRKEILKRTLFYFNKFRKNKNHHISDIIHKTFFAYFTQMPLKKIVKHEHNKILKKINTKNEQAL